ncbi:diguanylate cyclase [Duganella sp. FT80W]|uniref:diguanylate cyclase n=1 Tax=Duganella guangzhouensis TaxID=2666084 RepID=A0A6I2L1U8_9BURK|nr:diguanylate cyclase [Duganella guangzhouensis]MRW90506.1 diguanylate cyclase [Duganella guangzhouensis]
MSFLKKQLLSDEERAVYRIRRLTLRFAPQLESQFKKYYEVILLPRIRWAFGVAIMVMLAYAVLDHFMIPDLIRREVLLLRLAIILALALGLAVSFIRAARPYMQTIATLVAALNGLCVIGILFVGSINNTPLSYEGIILTVFYFYCTGALRMYMAAACGWFVCICYPLAEMVAGMPPKVLLMRTIFLATANVIGTAGAYFMEYAARQSYALSHQLHEMASRDFLTNLLNRRAFSDKVEILWRQSCRSQQMLAIAMIDVDFFKRYNDSYGHVAGDEVLKSVASVIRQHTRRPMDLAARYGGEEFIGVWHDLAPEAAARIIEEIHAGIQALAIPHAQSEAAGIVSLSVGMVTLMPHQGQKFENVLQLADAALYQAKDNGRNGSVIRAM